MNEATQTATETAKPVAPPKAPEAKAAAKPVESKPERFIALSESDFTTSADFNWPVTGAMPPAGTPVEHIIRPEFWANVRGKYQGFTTGALVRVMPKDAAWWAELLVINAGQGYAKVKLLRHEVLDAAASQSLMPEGYDIAHLPATRKYRVIRKMGSVVISDKCTTFEDALRECREDMKRLAA